MTWTTSLLQLEVLRVAAFLDQILLRDPLTILLAGF